MKLTRLPILLTLLLSMLVLTAENFDLKDFAISSYGLKSYNKTGNVRSEVTFKPDHKVLKISRYYYDQKDVLSKVEYYAGLAPEPEYIRYKYEENVLTESKKYNSLGRLKLITKHFFDGETEVKREHYDAGRKLRSYQVNHFDSNGLVTKKEYFSPNKKVFQYNVFHYNKKNQQVRVEIFKKDKLSKSYVTEYSKSGNIESICYMDDEENISSIYIHSYDDNDRLIEYKVYKKPRK